MRILTHDGSAIEYAEKKLAIFHLIDIVQKYDVVTPHSQNLISWQDVYLSNVMLARSSRSHWVGLIGKSIEDISLAWDLFAIDDTYWLSSRAIVVAVLQPMLDEKGIGCAVLTKALHRKRPCFVPICDDIVIRALGVKVEKKSAETIACCMDRLREVGRKNRITLSQIENFLTGMDFPYLTPLRILEALYWMEGTPRYQQLWKLMEAKGWHR